MNKNVLGFALLLLGLAVAGAVIYVNKKSAAPMVYAPRTMITALWEEYKRDYVDPDGRTVDRQRNNVTTSEGQSYTMLRAVWMDDKETFDLAWEWTKKNLLREGDHLFSWLYGERPDGTWGVMAGVGGDNSASDADTDIALALAFAYARFKDPSYLAEAREITDDLWKKEVVMIGGAPVLAANNLEKETSEKVIVVNPSYFAPYAYRLFAKIDPAHEWMDLVDSSYDIIRRSAEDRLNRDQSAGLPPDWIGIDRETGRITAPLTEGQDTSYGYEALRLPWRIALDWAWNKDPRAEEALREFSFLSREWQEKNLLHASYAHDGMVKEARETPVMYGGSLGYFIAADKDAAKEIYSEKLLPLYSHDFLGWKNKLSYYDSNWVWFGMALYHGLALDLGRSIALEKEPAVLSAFAREYFVKAVQTRLWNLFSGYSFRASRP